LTLQRTTCYPASAIEIGVVRWLFDKEDALARSGSVGKQIFEQVEALVKQGKSKTEAFAQIASDTGRNSGTVSANYYRVARASGTTKTGGAYSRAIRNREHERTASGSDRGVG
jgi:hypothetical protein